MKLEKILLILLFIPAFLGAQELSKPFGEGYEFYRDEIELTSKQREDEIAECIRKINELKQLGKISDNLKKPGAGGYIWPVKAGNNLREFNFWGISNFVDHDSLSPGLLDYNGGNRTYNNHQGTDIFTWPFPWFKMDSSLVEIAAAADGIIIAKRDGNFDRSCAMNGNQWNAVYVRNFDGNTVWYGHMKSGSLTEKEVGDTVFAGDFLGIVGSSGSSTGPHLHLEIHDADWNLIDPWMGPDNPSISESLWANQKPYYDSKVNRISTARKRPDFPGCSFIESPNESNGFAQGDTVYFITYYSDQLRNQVSNYTITTPENSIWTSWSNSLTSADFYAASWWGWYFIFPENSPVGNWKFSVEYENVIYTHDFRINNSAVTVKEISGSSGSFELGQNYPNPFNPTTAIEYSLGGQELRFVLLKVYNLLGQEAATLINEKQMPGRYKVTFDASGLSSGVYCYTLRAGSFYQTRKMILIR